MNSSTDPWIKTLILYNKMARVQEFKELRERFASAEQWSFELAILERDQQKMLKELKQHYDQNRKELEESAEDDMQQEIVKIITACFEDDAERTLLS